jgi:hypothetical protein
MEILKLMQTQREESASTALDMLGADRFTSFIQAVRGSSNCLAVELMDRQLSENADVEAAFFTGDRYGFQLSVTRTAPGTFLISFGCQAGGLEGDGGEWAVQFNEDGSVAQVSQAGRWIS